jgi:hypothetical protein
MSMEAIYDGLRRESTEYIEASRALRAKERLSLDALHRHASTATGKALLKFIETRLDALRTQYRREDARGRDILSGGETELMSLTDVLGSTEKNLKELDEYIRACDTLLADRGIEPL